MLMNKEQPLRNRKIAVVFLVIFASPLVFILFQRVLPFSRVWVYKSLFEYLGLGIGFLFILKKFIRTQKIIVVMVLSMCLFQAFLMINYWITAINNPKNIYNQFPNLISKLQKRNVKNVFVNQDVYNVFLRYNFLINKKPINIIVDKPVVKQKFDFLIVNKKKEFPEKVKIFNYKKNLYR